MEQPLLQRGIHFLRKAGFRRFAAKASLWARASLSQPFAAVRDRKSNEEYLLQLSKLPQEDGHVTIPVLDFTMKVRVDDPGLSKDLILHGIRERDAVHFLRPLFSGCKTIFEIGANQGYYLIQEALYSPNDVNIHAFEPHPDNVKTAKLNAKLNGIENRCHFVQAAVSNKRGKARLTVSRRLNWHTLTPAIEENLDFAGETIEVDTFSLDEYAADLKIERVDLIRMDVEGHESAIMKGATNIIARSPGIVIFLEFHTSLLRQSGESPEEFLRHLRALGLKCLTVCGNGRYLNEPSWDELIKGLELIISLYGTHMFFSKS